MYQIAHAVQIQSSSEIVFWLVNVHNFFFLRIEYTAGQRCARKSTEFASGSKVVDENKGDMEKFLVTQDFTQHAS